MPLDPFFERALTRRAFLGRGLAAAGGLAVAGGLLADAAWAGDTSAPDPKTYFPLVLSSDLYASAQPQRLVFALSHSTAKGIKFASGPAVTVRFKGPERIVDAAHASGLRPRRAAEGSRGVRGRDRRSTPPACGRSRRTRRARRCRSRSR